MTAGQYQPILLAGPPSGEQEDKLHFGGSKKSILNFNMALFFTILGTKVLCAFCKIKKKYNLIESDVSIDRLPRLDYEMLSLVKKTKICCCGMNEQCCPLLIK